jgi:hypothetical protein
MGLLMLVSSEASDARHNRQEFTRKLTTGGGFLHCTAQIQADRAAQNLKPTGGLEAAGAG